MIGSEVIETARTTPESYELQKLFRQMYDAGCTHVVMEVSSHALVLHRADEIGFSVGIFTNLTEDHLDFHKTMPLVLILVGFVYIVETLSDILQVTYFKLSHGKRIFKMAPIHHHFEMSGWSEVKIFTVFVSVTVAMCLIAWLGVMHRF